MFNVISNLFGNKGASAATSKATQKKSPSLNGGSGKPLPPMRRLTSSAEIPAHSAVLSGKEAGSKFRISLEKLETIIILQTGEGKCALIISEQIHGTPFFYSLRDKIQAEYEINFFGNADRGLISGFYTSASRNEEKKDSDHIKDMEKLVLDAMASEASDIHILIHDKGATVRFRVHGFLERITEWNSRDYALQFARTLHAVADEDSKPQTFTENTSCQMSITKSMPNGQKVKLRIQTTVAYPDGGLEIVMRILPVGSTARVKTLDELGYEEHHQEMLRMMLASPSGVTIIAGTTGSGKSTSLQTLSELVQEGNDGLKLTSVEDPPEYVLRNVTQIPVTRRKGDTENPFARAMRDAMRLDPDIVIVGEVRDKESAECLTAIVQSGHKVFTTIHADTIFNIIGRLQKMNLDNHTMSSRGFISGLIYQKLVRVLCNHCKMPYDPSQAPKDLAERVKQVTFPGDKLYVPKEGGCEYCRGRGVVGRTVCAEMVRPDKAILDYIRENNPNGAFEYWRSKKRTSSPNSASKNMTGVTCLEHGILKMRRGICSPMDVEHDLGLLTGEDDIDSFGEEESEEFL